MDDAFDTFRHERVRAREATAAPFPGRYICPVCQTEVLYASGIFVPPYFRHHPGTDHRECERYCRSFYNDVPLARHELEHVDAALIARLETVGVTRAVTFAVRYRAHGDVVSAEFVSGKVSIGYKIHHARREHYFRIARVEKEYSIKAYLNSGDFEHHLIKGFGKEPAVFRISERDSVRLASHRVLRPGAYLIATNRSIMDRLIPELHAESLRTIDGIYAVSIEIPEDPGPKILGNIQAVLGFDVTSTIATYAFLSPHMVTEVAADCWEVSIADAIVCYIRLSRHIAVSKLLIQRRKRGQLFVQYLPLDTDRSEFVVEADALDKDVDLFRIGVIADRPQFLCEIRRSSDAIDARSARLVFNMSESNHSFRLLWSSHQLPNALKSVRKAQLCIDSVLLPKGVEIHLGDSAGKHTLLSGEDIADKLTAFLKNSRLPCMLRGTGYPPVVLWPRTVSKEISAVESNAKRIAIRSRADARLASAFRRDRASAYSIRSLR